MCDTRGSIGTVTRIVPNQLHRRVRVRHDQRQRSAAEEAHEYASVYIASDFVNPLRLDVHQSPPVRDRQLPNDIQVGPYIHALIRNRAGGPA